MYTVWVVSDNVTWPELENSIVTTGYNEGGIRSETWKKDGRFMPNQRAEKNKQILLQELECASFMACDKNGGITVSLWLGVKQKKNKITLATVVFFDQLTGVS